MFTFGDRVYFRRPTCNSVGVFLELQGRVGEIIAIGEDQDKDVIYVVQFDDQTIESGFAFQIGPLNTNPQNVIENAVKNLSV